MWGHAPGCGCGLCSCLPRVFALIALGGGHPGFVPWVADRFRLVEADLRDELDRRGCPTQFTQANTPVARPPAAREGAGAATTTPPSADPLCLVGKGKPAEPPSELRPVPEGGEVVKEEEKPPATEVAAAAPPERQVGLAASSHRGPSHSHRDRRPRNSTGRKSRRRSRSRRDRSRGRRRRGDSRSRGERNSPRTPPSGHKERKTRPGKPPEPEGPPPGRSFGDRRPAEPSGHPRGTGWRGPIPRSNHPRWTSGTNKGITKRAKQERFNRRRGRRH